MHRVHCHRERLTMVSHAHQQPSTAVPEGRMSIPYLTPMMASIGGSEKKRPHWVRHRVVHNSNKQSIIIVSDYARSTTRNDGESSRMMGTTTSTDKKWMRTSSTLTFRTVYDRSISGQHNDNTSPTIIRNRIPFFPSILHGKDSIIPDQDSSIVIS